MSQLHSSAFLSLADLDRIAASRRHPHLSDSQKGVVDATAKRLGIAPPPTYEERMRRIDEQLSERAA